MRTSLPIVAALVFTGLAAAQEHVSFATQDGGTVYADLYGKGERVMHEILRFLSLP